MLPRTIKWGPFSQLLPSNNKPPRNHHVPGEFLVLLLFDWLHQFVFVVSTLFIFLSLRRPQLGSDPNASFLSFYCPKPFKLSQSVFLLPPSISAAHYPFQILASHSSFFAFMFYHLLPPTSLSLMIRKFSLAPIRFVSYGISFVVDTAGISSSL